MKITEITNNNYCPRWRIRRQACFTAGQHLVFQSFSNRIGECQNWGSCLYTIFLSINISSFGSAGSSFVPPGVHLFIISIPKMASLASFCVSVLAFSALMSSLLQPLSESSTLIKLCLGIWSEVSGVVKSKRLRFIVRWCWGGLMVWA